jgi:brefeldin A-resistance guanine nucleotide exchange factor 1
VLHSISNFKKDLLGKAAPLILQGIRRCIQQAGPLRNEIITSPDFWVILRALSINALVASAVFEILEDVTNGTYPAAVMADSYEPAVSLLNDFASAGSVGSLTEQQQDKRIRRSQQIKPQKPQ